MKTREHQSSSGEMRAAVFSDCERYRYALSVTWDPTLPIMQVIGLNPSTADELKDDPTIRKCKGFARRWGFGALLMTNLFAWRATDPNQLKLQRHPVGDPENTTHILRACESSVLCLAAWGVRGTYLDRENFICALIPGLVCLRTTKNGHPEHPLYIPYSTVPKPLNFWHTLHEFPPSNPQSQIRNPQSQII